MTNNANLSSFNTNKIYSFHLIWNLRFWSTDFISSSFIYPETNRIIYTKSKEWHQSCRILFIRNLSIVYDRSTVLNCRKPFTRPFKLCLLFAAHYRAKIYTRILFHYKRNSANIAFIVIYMSLHNQSTWTLPNTSRQYRTNTTEIRKPKFDNPNHVPATQASKRKLNLAPKRILHTKLQRNNAEIKTVKKKPTKRLLHHTVFSFEI
jgi:hypothetical protein